MTTALSMSTLVGNLDVLADHIAERYGRRACARQSGGGIAVDIWMWKPEWPGRKYLVDTIDESEWRNNPRDVADSLVASFEKANERFQHADCKHHVTA